MKQPSVPLTQPMLAALAELRRATLALEKKNGGRNPRQSVAGSNREEKSRLRRAMNDPAEGGGYGRKKRAEWD